MIMLDGVILDITTEICTIIKYSDNIAKINYFLLTTLFSLRK